MDVTQKKTQCIQSLFSLKGPFNFSEGTLLVNNIRELTSKAVEKTLKRHNIVVDDMFAVGNISAFRFNGNALSFAAKKDKLDILLQKTINGEVIDLIEYSNLIVDFVTELSELSNFMFNRYIFNSLNILSSEEVGISGFSNSFFPLSSNSSNKYVGLTWVDKEKAEMVRTEDFDIVTTLSKGLIKENNKETISLQVEVTTDQSNQSNRLGKNSIRKFLNYAMKKIDEKHSMVCKYVSTKTN